MYLGGLAVGLFVCDDATIRRYDDATMRRCDDAGVHVDMYMYM